MRQRRHPKGNSDHVVSAAVTAAEKQAWKTAADALDVSVSDLVRDSVNYYLEMRRASLMALAEAPQGPALKPGPASLMPSSEANRAGTSAQHLRERARLLTADPAPDGGASLTRLDFAVPRCRDAAAPTPQPKATVAVDAVVMRCPRCFRPNRLLVGVQHTPRCQACGASLGIAVQGAD